MTGDPAPHAAMSEAIERVRAVLVDVARAGLQRVTPGTSSEIHAASQWAHHARLTRIERELIALRTQVDRYLARDPLFRTDAFMDRANRLAWRTRCLQEVLEAGGDSQQIEQLVGVPRRTYTPVDASLLVVPLAMRAWCSDTDFMGVTTTFWAPDLGLLVEAGLARPTAHFGTDPRRLAWQLVNDDMGLTMQELSHGAWKLDGVRLATDGRLSLTRDTYAQVAAYPLATALMPLRCAGALEVLDRLETDALGPLDGGLGAWVYVEPAHFGVRVIDDTRARATCPLTDSQGCHFELVVPLKPENQMLVDNLQHLAVPESRPDGLIAWAQVSGERLALLPATAVFRESVDLKQRRRTLTVQQVHLSVESLGMVRR